MSLYECSCGEYYTISEEAEDIIGSCIKEGKPIEFIGRCPVCGSFYIHGGEPDIDLFDLSDIVLCFGREYHPETDCNLPVINNVLLEKCEEIESEFTTVDSKGVVHLRIEKKEEKKYDEEHWYENRLFDSEIVGTKVTPAVVITKENSRYYLEYESVEEITNLIEDWLNQF